MRCAQAQDSTGKKGVFPYKKVRNILIFQKRKGAIRERERERALCITQFMEPKINTMRKMYFYEEEKKCIQD